MTEPRDIEKDKAICEQFSKDNDTEYYGLDRDSVNSLIYALEDYITQYEVVKAEAEKWRKEALQQYPTPEAYDAACKALEKHRKRADEAEARIAELENETARLRHIAVRLSSRINITDEVFDYLSAEDDYELYSAAAIGGKP